MFVRSARGVEPNEQGRVAIRGAAMLLEELAHLRQETTQRSTVTLLRIGAPPFVAQGFLPKVLAHLATSTSAPQVHVQLQEEGVPLGGASPWRTARCPGFQLPRRASRRDRPTPREKLFDNDLVVVAPSGHPVARGKVNTWHELAAQRWILPAGSSMTRRVMDDVFRRAGVIAPVPVIESASPFTNLQLVKGALGIGVVATSTLAVAAQAKGVSRVSIEPEILSDPVALITRMSAPNPRLTVLREAIASMRVERA